MRETVVYFWLVSIFTSFSVNVKMLMFLKTAFKAVKIIPGLFSLLSLILLGFSFLGTGYWWERHHRQNNQEICVYWKGVTGASPTVSAVPDIMVYVVITLILVIGITLAIFFEFFNDRTLIYVYSAYKACFAIMIALMIVLNFGCEIENSTLYAHRKARGRNVDASEKCRMGSGYKLVISALFFLGVSYKLFHAYQEKAKQVRAAAQAAKNALIAKASSKLGVSEETLHSVTKVMANPKDLKKNLQDLKSADLSSLKEKANELKNSVPDVSALKEKAREVKGAVKDLSSIKDKADNFKGAVNNISSLKDEVKGAVNDLSSIKDKVDNFKGAVNNISSLKDELHGAVNDLSSLKDKANDFKSDMMSDLSSLQGKASELKEAYGMAKDTILTARDEGVLKSVKNLPNSMDKLKSVPANPKLEETNDPLKAVADYLETSKIPIEEFLTSWMAHLTSKEEEESKNTASFENPPAEQEPEILINENAYRLHDDMYYHEEESMQSIEWLD